MANKKKIVRPVCKCFWTVLLILLPAACTSFDTNVVYSNQANHVAKSNFFSKYRTGLSMSEIEAGTSVGVSSCRCFFGVYSEGDASIYKAMKHGRIREISYVDQEVFSVTFFPVSSWSIYEEYKTIVIGR